ncbi:hypothetical protein PS1_025747 [Malus domestica]
MGLLWWLPFPLCNSCLSPHDMSSTSPAIHLSRDVDLSPPPLPLLKDEERVEAEVGGLGFLLIRITELGSPVGKLLRWRSRSGCAGER